MVDASRNVTDCPGDEPALVLMHALALADG